MSSGRGILPGDGGTAVGDLPAHIDRGSGETVSCWRLSDEEMTEIQRTGVVWLSVWGLHPPVSVNGHYPVEE